MIKPSEINLLGKVYKITYCDNPSDVDIYKCESLWGQIDYWSRTIRIYEGERTPEDIFETILHEAIHHFATDLKIITITNANDKEDVIDLLAMALTDTFIRNGWLK